MKFFVVLIFLFLNAFGFGGIVVNVYDGDTITILSKDSQAYKIRLWGIDAPEKKQAFGEKSRAYLRNMIINKSVKVRKMGQDRYKRILGIVIFNGVDINAKMVESGYAWSYDKFSTKYKNLELQARQAKKGLWVDKKPIRPDEFRFLVGVKPRKIIF